MPGRRQEKLGVVISNRMQKTVVVKVERRVQDRLYKRFITRTSKFHAHDEENRCSVGDKVRIQETRPLSRLKRWRVVENLTQKQSGEKQG
jgi:small subunit ribosomal protein S17